MRKFVKGLCRRKGEAAWAFDFIVRGHRFWGSTGCTDRRAAERWLEGFKAEKKAAIDRHHDPRAVLTFAEAASRWYDEIGQHRSGAADLDRQLDFLTTTIGARTLISAIDDNRIARAVALRRSMAAVRRPEAIHDKGGVGHGVGSLILSPIAASQITPQIAAMMMV